MAFSLCFLIQTQKPLIKNIMNELLFTFNSKQLTPTLPKNELSQQLSTSTSSKAKTILPRPNIRTKKMKRYHQMFESENIKKQLIDNDNEFMGLENITSENLIRISEFIPTPDRSVQTIENKDKLKKNREVSFAKELDCQETNKTKAIISNWTSTGKRYSEQEHKIKQNTFRKRGLSLKEGPLVSYPSDQKKLPEVFRSKSIAHDHRVASKQSIELQAKKDKGFTPKGFKASKKVYYQFLRPLRSEKNLPEFEKERTSECQNVEDSDVPVTPVFRPY